MATEQQPGLDVPPAPLAPAWPLEKLEASLARVGNEEASRIPAVLVHRGNLCPTIRQDLEVLRQGKLRLERAGYVVLTAWLSPSHQQQASTAAHQLKRPDLSTKFRLRAAELATEDDALVSVSSWEASQNKVVSCMELLNNLQETLQDAGFPDRLGVERVRAFVVNRSDSMVSSSHVSSNRDQGMVTVPKNDLDIIMENPPKQHWVADPLPEAMHHFGLTQIVEAIRSGDHIFASRGMERKALRFLVAPLPAERAEFQADYEELCPTDPSVGPWDCSRFANRLNVTIANQKAEPGGGAEGKNLAVIVTCNYMGPAMRKDLEILNKARDRLEYAGLEVVGTWLCPAAKPGKEGIPLSEEFRLHCAALAAAEDELAAVGKWQLSNEGGEAPHRLVEALQVALSRRFEGSLEGRTIRVYYACASYDANTRLMAGMAPTLGRGVVVVPVSDEEMLLEKPHILVYVADALSSEAAESTPASLRDYIAVGDSAAIHRALPKAVSRFVAAPTEDEHKQYPGDFKSLGVQPSKIGCHRADAAQSRLTAAFRSFVGPSGCMRVDELLQLLAILDPTWTSTDSDHLLSGARFCSNGTLQVDDFIDSLFTPCQEAC